MGKIGKTLKCDRKVISDINNVEIDDMLSINIKNGIINAKVVEVCNGE